MSHILQSIFPTETGLIHIVGIGGIGMSGIAEILHGMGYHVQGSDLSEGYVTERLEKVGIKIFKQHAASNIAGISYLVKSTAIKDDNPEIIAARKAGIPIIKRAEMLAELMRFKNSIAISGTHGKTTTTSLVAALFEAAGTNPSVINGGIINSKSTNAYLGDGEYLIVEADESDSTFIKVPSYVAVITNIDPEHMDHYGTFDKVKDAFRLFIENLPFYGFGVVCYDHPVAREIGEKISDRRVLSYGIDSLDVDFRAVNIKPNHNGSSFDVEISPSYVKHKNLNFNKIEGLQLGIHGKHNVLNALSAIAIGVEKKFDAKVIKNAFTTFEGVKRRFTSTGVVDEISIIDDYAHHPAEIKATLSTARHLANLRGGNLIAVMQPHRYSRLHDLMDDFSRSFSDANHVIISDVYAAGELPIKDATPQTLMKKIKENSAIDSIYLDDPQNLANIINKLAKNNDLVVLLGAGSITKWAYELPKKLSELKKLEKLAKVSTAVALITFVSNNAFAFTIDDAIITAHENNYEVLAGFENLEATKISKYSAYSGFLPTVKAQSQNTRTDSKVAAVKSITKDKNVQANSLIVTQPIFSGGETLANIKIADNNIEAETANFKTTSNSIALNSVQAYETVLTTRSIHELNIKNEKVLSETLRFAKTRFKHGEVTKTDVMQAEAEYASAVAAKERAYGDMKSAEANFARVHGLEVPSDIEEITIDTSLVPSNIDELTDIALKSNPSLLASRFGYEASRYNVYKSWSNVLPDVSAQAQLTETDRKKDINNNSDANTYTLNVVVPLFQSGSEYADIAQKQHLSKKADFDAKEVERKVRENCIKAWNGYRTAQAVIRSSKEAIDFSEEALEGVREEAKIGTRTTLNVLEAERQLFNARVNLRTAQKEMVVSVYTILQLMGSIDPVNISDASK